MRFNIIIISNERKFIQKEAERKTIMTHMPLTKRDSADPRKILMPEKNNCSYLPAADNFKSNHCSLIIL